jgi:hypothetical protein
MEGEKVFGYQHGLRAQVKMQVHFISESVQITGVPTGISQLILATETPPSGMRSRVPPQKESLTMPLLVIHLRGGKKKKRDKDLSREKAHENCSPLTSQPDLHLQVDTDLTGVELANCLGRPAGPVLAASS